MWRNVALGVLFFSMSGCAAVFVKNAQQASAGHTGCVPEENEITNVTNMTWNATCKGTVYLCSMSGKSVSCALAK
jgi:hypothetical protein